MIKNRDKLIIFSLFAFLLFSIPLSIYCIYNMEESYRDNESTNVLNEHQRSWNDVAIKKKVHIILHAMMEH